MRSIFYQYCFKISLAILIFSTISGCSYGTVLVKRSSLDGKPPVALARVALLLDSSPVSARQERVSAVTEAVRQALQTKGFAVLDDRLVAGICAKKRCDNQKLISKFDLDAVGHLKITMLSSNNFVLGYLASISGELSFEDRSDTVIEKIEHRETENSGLLSNTGQVITAFASQANAYSGDTFAGVATQFGRKLVAQMASPQDRSAALSPATIKEVKVIEKDSLLKICVEGSPASIVTLETTKGARFSLTETSAGNYCGGFRFFPAGAVTVRLNTAFGAGEQRMITPIMMCRGLDPAPEIIAGKNLGSTSSGSQVKNAAGGLQINAHSSQTLACPGTQYALYISKSPTGPFTKLAALSGIGWRPNVAENAKLRAAGEDAAYVLIKTPARSPTAPIVKRLNK